MTVKSLELFHKSYFHQSSTDSISNVECVINIRPIKNSQKSQGQTWKNLVADVPSYLKC